MYCGAVLTTRKKPTLVLYSFMDFNWSNRNTKRYDELIVYNFYCTIIKPYSPTIRTYPSSDALMGGTVGENSPPNGKVVVDLRRDVPLPASVNEIERELELGSDGIVRKALSTWLARPRSPSVSSSARAIRGTPAFSAARLIVSASISLRPSSWATLEAISPPRLPNWREMVITVILDSPIHVR